MKKVYSLMILFLIGLNVQSFGQVPMLEGFEEGGTFPPTGWLNTGGTNTCSTATAGAIDPPCSPYAGSYMLFWDSYGIDGGNSLLTSPVITYNSRAGAATNITFWWYRDCYQYNTTTYTTEGVDVYMNTTPGTIAGGTLLGFVPRAGVVSTSGTYLVSGGTSTTTTSGWYQYTFSVPASYTGTTNYIVFDFVSQYGDNCYMDNVQWTNFPGAGVTVSPTSLAFGNVFAGVTSAVHTFSITAASGLTSGGSLLVTAPANYLVSTSPTGPFTATATVAYTGTSITTAVPIYAEFVAPGTIGTYTGNIAITSGGLTAAVNVAVTGTSICNPTAITLTGPAGLCTGQASTITASPTGGAWSSSNTTIATVVSSGATTGSAVGGAVGTASIVYTMPSGCSASLPVTVNLSPPFNTITGGGGYCAGSAAPHIGLNGSVTGISYGLYSGGSLAFSVAGTGSALDFGPISTPGTYTVIAITPAGCSQTMIGSTAVFLNPNPTLTAGSPSSVCAGSSIGLSATPSGGTWTSNNIAAASVGASNGTVAGIVPGTATIAYTLTGGCNVSKVITVNATPAAITGTLNVCAGSTTSLGIASTGGTWSSSNNSLATVGIGTGVVSGVSAGTPNISYSFSTGCYSTAPVVVNLLPSSAVSITGGGPYCAGSGVHVGLSYGSSGITYQLYNGAITVGSALSGAGSSLDFGLQYAAGTYTVFARNPITTCSITIPGSTTITINPLPNSSYTVTGGGSYCSGGTGVPISLSNSDFGTSYQLLNGGPIGSAVAGAGHSVSFGLQTTSGTYTVLATTAAGCMATMTGSAAITVNPLPNAYPMSSGGAFCAGGTGADVMLQSSDIGTSYQLYNGSMSTGSAMPGTGSAIDFGLQTAGGNYTVVATTGTTPACSANMTGDALVTIEPLPVPYTVNGGGPYCIGGVHVGLSFSDAGFSYQLYVNGSATGTAVLGTSSSIDFGVQITPGVYTVQATNNTTTCVGNMSGSAIVTLNTLPTAYTMTGGGPYCTGGTGSPVGLALSSPGVSYQLYNGGTPSGLAMTGTGASLNFGLQTAPGTYTITGTNTGSGCINTMLGADLITETALPTAYNIMTAGSSSSYCAGGEGVDILLNGSDIGTNYQLYKGTLPVGTSMPGTSSSLDFGFKTLPGVYTIVASTPATTCKNNMSGDVPLTINALPNVYTTTGGGNYCIGTSGVHVGVSGSNAGISYQLYNNNILIPGAVQTGTGVSLDFGYQTNTGIYTVIATNTATSCTSNMLGSPAVVENLLPDTFSLTGDGSSYCASASGSPVGLIGSAFGISYQLYNGIATAGAAVPGTGAPITFGNHAAGTYTVVAMNSATGCTNNMPGSASISVNPLPAAMAVNGTGNTCSGGTGAPVGLDSSVSGINYQLYFAGLPTPTIVGGTGTAISFGPQTSGGVYTAVGIDGSTGCTNNMAGSATITVIPGPGLNNVTGGGNFCTGGAGVHVGLNGSTLGISYQLMNGSAAVGGLVPGVGSAIDFGLQNLAGTYSVVASPGGACQTTMSGIATVVANPLPAVETITGGGVYCAGGMGADIALSSSVAGTSYQLYNGSTPVGAAMPGGSTVDFGLQTLPGTYTVIATNLATTCTNTMAGSGTTAIIVGALPHAYNVMGGGAYCTGGAGVHVELSSSNTDINYQLYNNGIATALPPMAGSGTELDFGLQTAAGNYTVFATDRYTDCTNNMADTATVSVNAYLTPVVTISQNPAGTINPGQTVTFVARTTVATAGASPMFQWYVDGLPVTGATDSTFTSNIFANGDSVKCEVTSTGMCGGLTGNHAVRISISTVGVQQITSPGSNIALMPNPNKGAFTIKGSLGTTDDEEVSVEITDMVGHVVYSDKVMSYGGSINANVNLNSTLANGMYIVSLRSASANQVFHMVIEE